MCPLSASMAALSELLEPRGFRARALLPAYGLAEATLAVTGCRRSEVPTAARVGQTALRIGHHVDIVERAGIEGEPEKFRRDGWVVGCGPPLEGIRVAIVDDDGEILPSGHFGHIAVAGSTVTTALRALPRPARALNQDPERLTADVGFLIDDELFVIGRREDRIDLPSREIYLDDLEAVLSMLPDAPIGRFVCLADPGSHAVVALIVEQAEPRWLAEAKAALHRRLGPTVQITVLEAGRGAILRTTSGKPRRQTMWECHSTGNDFAVEHGR